MKCHKTGNTEQNFSSLGCLCSETEDGNPLFLGRSRFHYFVPPPTSCSSCYLSCLYMWKTEQQTAASIFFRPSAELDFPPFPQRLWEIARCSLKKGAKGESNLCFHLMSKHRQVTNKFTLGVFFPWRWQLHTWAAFWHVKRLLSVTQ